MHPWLLGGQADSTVFPRTRGLCSGEDAPMQPGTGGDGEASGGGR